MIEAYLGSAATELEPAVEIMTDVLDIEGLTAGYDRAAVIRDLDLTVGAGEVVALLGANGAGKTTTLQSDLGAGPSDERAHHLRRSRPRRASRPRSARGSGSCTSPRAAGSSTA